MSSLELSDVKIVRVPGPVVAGIYDDCDPVDSSGKDGQHGVPYPDDHNAWDCG